VQERTSSHIAFPIPEDLRNETLSLIAELRESEDHAGYADQLIDVVDRISDHGMTFFFIYPVKLVGLGAVTVKTLQVAIQSAKRAVMAVSRQIARRLDRDQLLRIADFLESIVFDFEVSEESED
jgi:hypothetical protein